MWVRLREALRADQVVVIQGDRVLPGQKGQPIPFLDGDMEFPALPVTLAMLSGAPILPIFSLRTEANRIRLLIEEPIYVGPIRRWRRAPSTRRWLNWPRLFSGGLWRILTSGSCWSPPGGRIGRGLHSQRRTRAIR